MGRTLPWAGQTTTSASKHRAASEARSESDTRHVKEFSTKNTDTYDGSRPGTPHRSRKRAHSRTPSTSPPPGPPPISPLREGYDNDDLYIMVEDEFYSVAQSYTAHLHHAEYKRLMRKAKEAPSREIADLSPSKPRNVRDRARRDVLRQRQRSALDAMANRVDHDSGDDDDDSSRKGTGTSGRGNGLAGLMAKEGQTKTSLIGLERLPSSTRAAMGYEKASDGTGSSLRRPQKGSPDIGSLGSRKRDESDEMGIQKGALGNTRLSKHMVLEDSLAGEGNGEDTWGQERRYSSQKASHRHVKEGSEHRHSVKHDTSRFRHQPHSHIVAADLSNKRPNPLKQSLIDELEEGLGDEDIEILSAPSSASPTPNPVPSPSPPLPRYKVNHPHKTHSKSEHKRNHHEENKKRDKKSRLDEVPFFMFR